MTGTWGTGGVRCRRLGGTREGDALMYFQPRNSSRKWVVVVWDGHEQPVCELGSHLMFKHLGERTFKVDRTFQRGTA